MWFIPAQRRAHSLKRKQNTNKRTRNINSNYYSPVPKCLNNIKECTNFFCWQSTGFLMLMFKASRACRWKKVRPWQITVNICRQKLLPQFGLLTRCSAIDDDGGSDGVAEEPSVFSSFKVICCCILVLSRCSVLPTYALSQLHLNKYIRLLLSWVGITSFTEEGNIGLEVKITRGFTWW